MRIKDKVAIITGSGRGIGKAIALRMAEEGAMVVVTDVNYENCLAAKAEIEGAGGKAIAVKCDVSKRSDVEALVDATIKAFGRVDVLVNNAGITRDGFITDLTDEKWDMVLEVNLKSMYLCIQAVAKHMVPQLSGKIINIASIVGEMGNMGQTNYVAAKAGAIGIAKSLAKELAKSQIQVNAIAPGFIDSEMTAAVPEKVKEMLIRQIPAGRMGKTSEIAAAAVFLASEDADYITGQVIRVNGGLYV